MHTRNRVGLAMLFAVAACSGDPTASSPTGSLAITISGLPAGDSAYVSVTGPDTLGPIMVTRSRTLTNLPVGDYTVAIGVVDHGTTTYGCLPESRLVTVSGSTPVTVKVVYKAMTGQLAVTVNGPPGGLATEVVVWGPFGYPDTIRVSGVTTLTGLPLGNYSVYASQESGGGTTYVAPAAYQTIYPDQLSGVVTVTYVDVASVISLTLNITGLPNGVDAAVVAKLPCPYTSAYSCRSWRVSRTFTKSASWAFIRPGTYSITAPPVTVGTTPYTATPAVQSVVVTATSTGHIASVVYAP